MATTASRRGTPLTLTAALLALLLGLTACASGDAENGAGDGTAEAPAAQEGAEDGGDAAGDSGGETPDALAFETRTVDGDAFAGADLAGEPTVLWFWAPWCTICRGEAAGVAEAAARHSGDVEFIGVAGLGEVEAMRGFVSDTGTGELTHLVDEDGSIWSGFGVASQPAFAFVSADGTFATVQGTLSDDDLDAQVDLIADGS
ncbi:redoxin domain-containing protein [Nocardiopsis sp. NPDC049922]|uniref:redoxin domain-containing protein n=1 Tax=Nocardiopsis sp. NPDC049922 TaxID=3155157 RepID=UPI0033D1154C